MKVHFVSPSLEIHIEQIDSTYLDEKNQEQPIDAENEQALINVQFHVNNVVFERLTSLSYAFLRQQIILVEKLRLSGKVSQSDANDTFNAFEKINDIINNPDNGFVPEAIIEALIEQDANPKRFIPAKYNPTLDITKKKGLGQLLPDQTQVFNNQQDKDEKCKHKYETYCIIEGDKTTYPRVESQSSDNGEFGVSSPPRSGSLSPSRTSSSLPEAGRVLSDISNIKVLQENAELRIIYKQLKEIQAKYLPFLGTSIIGEFKKRDSQIADNSLLYGCLEIVAERYSLDGHHEKKECASKVVDYFLERITKFTGNEKQLENLITNCKLVVYDVIHHLFWHIGFTQTELKLNTDLFASVLKEIKIANKELLLAENSANFALQIFH